MRGAHALVAFAHACFSRNLSSCPLHKSCIRNHFDMPHAPAFSAARARRGIMAPAWYEPPLHATAHQARPFLLQEHPLFAQERSCRDGRAGGHIAPTLPFAANYPLVIAARRFYRLAIRNPITFASRNHPSQA
jgi:hypothetical protein